MKFKMFSGGNSNAIVAEVNQWLSAEPSKVHIHHTETKLTPTELPNGAASILFSVWYDEDAS